MHDVPPIRYMLLRLRAVSLIVLISFFSRFRRIPECDRRTLRTAGDIDTMILAVSKVGRSAIGIRDSAMAWSSSFKPHEHPRVCVSMLTRPLDSYADFVDVRVTSFVSILGKKPLVKNSRFYSTNVGLLCSLARRINKLTVFSYYYFSDSIPLGIRIPLL